jgi:hypothetical protein
MKYLQIMRGKSLHAKITLSFLGCVYSFFGKASWATKRITWATFALQTVSFMCQVNKEKSQAHVNHTGLGQKPWWPQREEGGNQS